MQQGWIKAYRSLREHWLWQDKPFSKGQAFIDLLFLANHTAKKVPSGDEIITIPRGEFATSIRTLCDNWGWSNTKVKRFLNVLQTDRMIVVKSDSKKTVVKVLNYNKYQDIVNLENDTETSSVHQQNDTKTFQKHTNKNVKNIKNDKNNIRVSKDTLCQTEAVNQVINEWNSLSELGVKPVTKISNTSTRYKSLMARIKQDGLEDVLKAIDNIRQSDFLLGRKTDFIITFDWFVRPNNFNKVFDGNYTNARNSAKNYCEY